MARKVALEKVKTLWNWKHLSIVLGSAAVLLGLASIVIFLSGLMQGPTDSKPPNAAEWLSAISTFWGAVAGGLAAIGTAGALLIAAYGYKHQVEEKERQAEDRRQQAAAEAELAKKKLREQAIGVAFLTPDSQRFYGHVVLTVHNGSSLPIKNVVLVCFDRKGQQTGQALQQVVGANMDLELEKPRDEVDTAWTTFDDAAGVKWKLYVNGDLEER